MSTSAGELPAGLAEVRRTQIFDQDTMPAALRHSHRTARGVWGVIRVVEGRLLYRVIAPPSEQVVGAHHSVVVQPGEAHEVEPLGKARFFVEFHADPARGKMPTDAPEPPSSDAGPRG